MYSVETVDTPVTDHIITDNEWELIEKHLNEGVTEAAAAAAVTQVSIVNIYLTHLIMMSVYRVA